MVENKKVEIRSTETLHSENKFPLNASAAPVNTLPIESPQVITQGLPAGLTPGLSFTKVQHSEVVENTFSTGQILKQDTLLEKNVLNTAPIVNTAAVPQHQTIVEKIPVSNSEAKEILRSETVTTKESSTLLASNTATTSSTLPSASLGAGVVGLQGVPYEVPCYLFSWSDNLHIEIPKLAKKTIKNSAASVLVNEEVYAHSGRHLPGRKRRQRWLFTKDGRIISEYNPELVLTCYNNLVTVQRRDVGSAPGFGLCQQWILKPSTDSNFFYICCAKNPNLSICIDKGLTITHKGYPLSLKPLGTLSTAWSFDTK